MNTFEKEERHPSFGMLEISRVSSNPPVNMFGSSIRHSNYIVLRIHEGRRHRDLHRDWYMADKTIIEVTMSQTQFAEAITSMNIGSGVPVTLSRIQGEGIEPCPEIHKREEFEKEFRERCLDLDEKVKGMIEKAGSFLTKSGAVSMGDRKGLIEELRRLRQEIRSNIPFVQKSFDEQMEKTIVEGKGEIEAFFNNAVQKLGIEALQDKYGTPEMIGYGKEG